MFDRGTRHAAWLASVGLHGTVLLALLLGRGGGVPGGGRTHALLSASLTADTFENVALDRFEEHPVVVTLPPPDTLASAPATLGRRTPLDVPVPLTKFDDSTTSPARSAGTPKDAPPIDDDDPPPHGPQVDAPRITFFDSEASGRTVVFVVDASRSMRGGRFQRAVVELQRSLRRLDREQSFYVVLFNETAIPLYHPDPATSFQEPTAAVNRKTAAWLRRQKPGELTDPVPALETALRLGPDSIFLLADGELPATALPLAETARRAGTTIHTLAFDRRRARVLEMVAKRTRGTFRHVR